jgi:hypothetical protein
MPGLRAGVVSVALDVVGCGPEPVRVVVEQPDPLVVPVAQQVPEMISSVVVVDRQAPVPFSPVLRRGR